MKPALDWIDEARQWSQQAQEFVDLFDNAGESVDMFEGFLNTRIFNQHKVVDAFQRAMIRGVKIRIIAGPILMIGTVPSHILISEVPPGDAPLWVRKQWRGKLLPIAQDIPTGTLQTASVALDEKLKNFTGYNILFWRALRSLSKGFGNLKRKKAALWWLSNAPHKSRTSRLVFKRELCIEVFPDWLSPGKQFPKINQIANLATPPS